MSDERRGPKHPPADTVTSRRAALKRIAELGALVAAPAALVGCSDDSPYSSTYYLSCSSTTNCSEKYYSGAYSSGGGYSSGSGYSSYSGGYYSNYSSYSSSYSSQYCNSYGSLYYYSYYCYYS